MSLTHRLMLAVVVAALLSAGAWSVGTGAVRFPPNALRAARALLPAGRAPMAPDARLGALAPAGPPAPTSRTDQAIQRVQQRLRAQPDDQQSYVQLGAGYLQKARETGDSAYYALADGVLTRAIELGPNDTEAMAALGTLALARHQFTRALEWGQRAQALNPNRAAVYGVVGDALVELGRYDEAIPIVQRMVNLRPDLASYSRVSYLRELHGDLEGAIDTMQMAVRAGPPNTESTAWVRVQLGNLYFYAGDLGLAESEYQQASRFAAPATSYAPALAGLARVHAAKAEYGEAAALLERVIAIMPNPDHVILLGDVYRAAGNSAAAARTDELARAIAQLFRANGVDVDLELALFEADHAQDAAASVVAVQTARAAYERRPASVHAQDVLAWALYRAGRPVEALPYAREALRLGSHDPLMHFHAGAIAAAAELPVEAQADLELALSFQPQFSVRYSTEAKQLLAQLKGAKE